MTEYAWVIEGDGVYWDGRGLTQSNFSKKHEDAVRFSRYGDAERIKHWLLESFAVGLRVTQHGWD